MNHYPICHLDHQVYVWVPLTSMEDGSPSSPASPRLLYTALRFSYAKLGPPPARLLLATPRQGIFKIRPPAPRQWKFESQLRPRPWRA